MKGETNRNGKAIKAILIRCIPEGYAEPCPVDGNLAKSSEIYRESYHYIIKGNGTVVSDVPENQTSWALKPFFNVPDCGMGSGTLEYPECCKILWKPFQDTVAGQYVDDVLLTIAIEVPSISANSYLNWAHKNCSCDPNLSKNFSATQITGLARLLQYLFIKYPAIEKNSNGIQLFDNINLCEISECGCNVNPSELICLATQYCEPVAGQEGKHVPTGEVVWIHGYDKDFLPVREKLADAINRLI
jgi:hypothetical protein